MKKYRRSFMMRSERINTSITLLKNIEGYNPDNDCLKLDNLKLFYNEVSQKNQQLHQVQDRLYDMRIKRSLNMFRQKDSAEDCLENRLKCVLSYLCAEMGEDSSVSLKVKAMLGRLHSDSNKKKAKQPEKQSHPQSEQSFISLIGFSEQIIGLLKELGTKYNPVNQSISLVSLNSFTQEMSKLNVDITKLEETVSGLIKERKILYEGESGVDARFKMIKHYLASLPGGKKSIVYISFVRIALEEN